MRTEDGACVGGGGGVEEFWTLRFVRDVGEGEQGDGIGDWRLGTGLLTKGGDWVEERSDELRRLAGVSRIYIYNSLSLAAVSLSSLLFISSLLFSLPVQSPTDTYNI